MNLVAKEYIAAQILMTWVCLSCRVSLALLMNARPRCWSIPMNPDSVATAPKFVSQADTNPSSSEWWPRLRWAEPENARYRRPHAHGNNINSRQLIKIG